MAALLRTRDKGDLGWGEWLFAFYLHSSKKRGIRGAVLHTLVTLLN